MFVLILELARIRNAKGVGSTPLSKADTYATAETPQACTSLGLYAVVYSGI